MADPGLDGYEFDPAAIAQRITDWEQVLDDIRNDANQLREAQRQANPPSADQPALKHAQDTRTSLQAAIDQNTAMQQYARQWIDALRKANDTYLAHDQEISGSTLVETTEKG